MPTDSDNLINGEEVQEAMSLCFKLNNKVVSDRKLSIRACETHGYGGSRIFRYVYLLM